MLWTAFLAPPIATLAQTTPAGQITVVSAGSLGDSTAPDSIAVVYGEGLASVTATHSDTGALPTELGGIRVLINLRPAALLFVSPTQVNFVIPPDTEEGAGDVVVQRATVIVARGTTKVRHEAPAVFTQDGSVNGSALAANAVTGDSGPFSIETVANPGADKRTRIAVFGTGWRHASSLVAIATDTSGRTLDFPIESAGPASQQPWLDQLNLVVPEAADGAAKITLQIGAGAALSNPVSLELRRLRPIVITRLSRSAGPPGAQLDIELSNASNIDPAQIQIYFELPDGSRVLAGVLAATADAVSTMVPPSAFPGEWYAGPARVCLDTHVSPTCLDFTIEPRLLPPDPPGTLILKARGDDWQQLLDAFDSRLSPEARRSLADRLTQDQLEFQQFVHSASPGQLEVLSELESLLAAVLTPAPKTSLAHQPKAAGELSCARGVEAGMIEIEAASAGEHKISHILHWSLFGAVALQCVISPATCATEARSILIPQIDLLSKIFYYLGYKEALTQAGLYLLPIHLAEMRADPASHMMAPGEQSNFRVIGVFRSRYYGTSLLEVLRAVILNLFSKLIEPLPGSIEEIPGFKDVLVEVSYKIADLLLDKFTEDIPKIAAFGSNAVEADLSAASLDVDPQRQPEASIQLPCSGNAGALTGLLDTHGIYPEYLLIPDSERLSLLDEKNPPRAALQFCVGNRCHYLQISPDEPFQVSGKPGSFSAARNYKVYRLTNASKAPLRYSIHLSYLWVTAQPSSGVLPAGGTVDVTISLSEEANRLPAGSYDAAMLFQNDTGGDFTICHAYLIVLEDTAPDGGGQPGSGAPSNLVCVPGVPGRYSFTLSNETNADVNFDFVDVQPFGSRVDPYPLSILITPKTCEIHNVDYLGYYHVDISRRLNGPKKRIILRFGGGLPGEPYDFWVNGLGARTLWLAEGIPESVCDGKTGPLTYRICVP